MRSRTSDSDAEGTASVQQDADARDDGESRPEGDERRATPGHAVVVLSARSGIESV